MYSSPISKAWYQILSLCRENEVGFSLSLCIYTYMAVGVTLVHLYLVDMLTGKDCCSFVLGGRAIELINGYCRGMSRFVKKFHGRHVENANQTFINFMRK